MQLVLLGLWFCLPFFSFKLIAKFCLYSPINLMPGDSVVHQTCASFEMKNLCSQIMCVQGANEGPLTSAGLWFFFWFCLLPIPTGSSAALHNSGKPAQPTPPLWFFLIRKSCPGPTESAPQLDVGCGFQLPTRAPSIHPWVAEGRDLNGVSI